MKGLFSGRKMGRALATTEDTFDQLFGEDVNIKAIYKVEEDGLYSWEKGRTLNQIDRFEENKVYYIQPENENNPEENLDTYLYYCSAAEV
jgi:hypothetical protein